MKVLNLNIFLVKKDKVISIYKNSILKFNDSGSIAWKHIFYQVFPDDVKTFCKNEQLQCSILPQLWNFTTGWLSQRRQWTTHNVDFSQCQDTKPHEKLVDHQHYLFKTISFVYFTRNGIVLNIYIFENHCHLLFILRIDVSLCVNGKFKIRKRWPKVFKYVSYFWVQKKQIKIWKQKLLLILEMLLRFVCWMLFLV